jgi:hypothetical protein
VIQAVATLYSRIFIIVDALDECQTADGCRSRFLADIFALQAARGEVNIFATSRFNPEISKKFEQATHVEIRASDEDIQRYLEGQMHRLEPFIHQDQELQRKIKTEISSAVDGM